jgi:hypothetical protein
LNFGAEELLLKTQSEKTKMTEQDKLLPLGARPSDARPSRPSKGERKPYGTPALIEYGPVSVLTMALSSGPPDNIVVGGLRN